MIRRALLSTVFPCVLLACQSATPDYKAQNVANAVAEVTDGGAGAPGPGGGPGGAIDAGGGGNGNGNGGGVGGGGGRGRADAGQSAGGGTTTPGQRTGDGGRMCGHHDRGVCVPTIIDSTAAGGDRGIDTNCDGQVDIPLDGAHHAHAPAAANGLPGALGDQGAGRGCDCTVQVNNGPDGHPADVEIDCGGQSVDIPLAGGDHDDQDCTCLPQLVDDTGDGVPTGIDTNCDGTPDQPLPGDPGGHNRGHADAGIR